MFLNHTDNAPEVRQMFKAQLEQREKPKIKEIHLGGGTPTFFSSENLESLISGIFAKADKAPVHEFSFEGHPNNTTREQLQKLYDLGYVLWHWQSRG